MTKFVNTEYLIASAFVYLTEERFITLKAFYHYQDLVQTYCNENDIDTVILRNLDFVKDNFQDYFTIHIDAGIIVLNKDISKEILCKKFICAIPLYILEAFEKVAKRIS